MKLSVFINTFNEAKKIRSCLESVSWAHEIVVVDMDSQDATLSVVREYTDKIYSFDQTGYCEPARKFAYEKTTGDWILNIDADEIVTVCLKRELLRIAGQGLYDAVYIPRKNYFWGREMEHCGCGLFQDRPLRFYKRGAVEFNATIHAGIRLKDSRKAFRIDDPKACLLHFSYVSPEQYFEKMDKYTTIEARALFQSGKGYEFRQALKDAWNAFRKRFFKKGQGRKDGAMGFIYCVWTAVYKLNVYAKLALMKAYQTSDYAQEIQKKYDGLMAQALKEMREDRGETREES